MKNFKKVLALVLAVATVLAIAVTASAATPAYTDKDSIKRTEAVEVLGMIGVLNGFEDGTFKPEGDVTRAQFAKIICTVLNSGEDVGDQYKGACVFTDAASNWAAGYIAYCNQEGIISGKNATTFKPDDKVTGVEAAKMLLGVLGYKAESAGLTGSAWKSNTLSYARKSELLEDMGNVDLGAALNRENTAQMVLNTLKAYMVEVDTAGSYYVVGNEIKQAPSTYTDTTTVMMEEYFGREDFGSVNRLQCDTTAADEYGHAGNTWTFKGESVGPFVDTPVLTYENAVTGATLYTALGKPKFDENNIQYVVRYVDGIGTTICTDGTWTSDALAINADNDEEIASRGSKTEVYLNDDGDVLTIVTVYYYVAQVNTFKADELDAAGDVKTYGYITLTDVNKDSFSADTNKIGSLGAGKDVNGDLLAGEKNSFKLGSFTRSDATNKTVVVYTKGYDKDQTKSILMSVEPATAATDTVSSYSLGTDKTITFASGTTVYLSSKYFKNTAGLTFDVNTSLPYYTDPLGNVLCATSTVSNDFAYIYSVAYGTDALGTTDDTDVIKAQLLLSDGTLKIVTLDGNTVTDINATFGGSTLTNKLLADAYKGKVYAYTANSDGTYALNLNRAGDVVAAGATRVTVSTGSPYMKAIIGGDTTTCSVICDANTVFVVETKDSNDNNVYTAYTGISNVPGFYTNNSGTTDVHATWASNDIDAGSKVAAVVFLLDAEVEAVDNSAVGMLFKDKANDAVVTTLGSNSNTITYYTVNAVVDGAVTKVKVASSYYTNTLKDGVNLFNNSKIDSDGLYTSVKLSGSYADKMTAEFKAFESDENGVTGNFNNGVITLVDADDESKTYAVSADLPVYIYNKEKATLTADTISLVTGEDLVAADNAISVLFDVNKIMSSDSYVPSALYITVTK